MPDSKKDEDGDHAGTGTINLNIELSAFDKAGNKAKDIRQDNDEKGHLFRDGRQRGGLRSSSDFEAYYNSQGICDAEHWRVVVQRLATPLPLTLKVLSSPDPARPSVEIVAILTQLIEEAEVASRAELGDARYSALGAVAPVLRQIEEIWPEAGWWEVDAPDGQAWHMPPALRQFLFRCDGAGLLRVQELASALPILIADRQPTFVVDLCAAPGSKSLGLLETMDLSECGIVVANELSATRAAALRDRAQRHAWAAERLLVTNVDAAKFPVLQWAELVRTSHDMANQAHLHQHGRRDRCFLNMDEACTALEGYCLQQTGKLSESGGSNPWWRLQRRHPDLVLADVPCSADGTVRKTPDLWATWSTARGLNLFPKQLAILRRALELVAPGGQVIYSTCSLDPVQDEAVVSAALMIHNLKREEICDTERENSSCWLPVHLENPDAKLSLELAASFMSGMQHWGVPSPKFSTESQTIFHSWSEVPSELRSTKGPKLRKEMFRDFGGDYAKECKNCRRVLPSAAFNSGGFFFAVFRKAIPLHETKAKSVFAPRSYPVFRPAVKAINGFDPVKGCVMKFYGLFTKEEEAAIYGVERFPLENVGLAIGSQEVVVLHSPQATFLQERHLRLVGGGLPLLFKMKIGSNVGFFGQEDRSFAWRPACEAASLLGRCCSRRVLALSWTLLLQLLDKRRLEVALIPECCFIGCRSWGANESNKIVPGGVVVGLDAEIAVNSTSLPSKVAKPCGPPFFAALLSSETLLLLGSHDERRIAYDILDRLGNKSSTNQRE